MVTVTEATIKGYNQFVEEQQKVEGKTFITLTLFDTFFDTRFIAQDINTVPTLGSLKNSYVPSGMTALLDAVGDSIKKTEKWISENGWNGQVKVVVLTDGEENASRGWHINNPRKDNDDRDLAGLIDWKCGEGWDFVFLGAGGTDWLERTFVSLPRDNFFAYSGDSVSTGDTYAIVASSMTRSRSTGQTLGSTMQQQQNNQASTLCLNPDCKICLPDDPKTWIHGC